MSTKNGFRPIPGWPNYSINKQGKIFRKYKNAKTRERKWSFTGGGYAYIHLCDAPRLKVEYIHRLIWLTFIAEIPEGMEIDHINKISDDNRLENLRLATKQENLSYRWN